MVFDKGLGFAHNDTAVAHQHKTREEGPKVTTDDFQEELDWMHKGKKDEAKEPEVKDEDLQRELEWMRMERRGETKKSKAAPEQPSPEQSESTDELRAELDEIRRDQKEPVQQATPESKQVEQPKEEKEEAPEAGEEEERFCVVKRGDSLSKISEKVYGDANRWREIYRASKDKIENPRLIYPKQKLRIP
jgi:nucleoid-associated protein YgaU